MNHMDDVGCALTVCIYFATIPGDLRCNECIMTAKNESIILFCLFFLLRSTLAPEHGNNPVYFQCSVWHFERVTDLSANRFRFICLFFVLEFSTAGITNTHTLDAPPEHCVHAAPCQRSRRTHLICGDFSWRHQINVSALAMRFLIYIIALFCVTHVRER